MILHVFNLETSLLPHVLGDAPAV